MLNELMCITHNITTTLVDDNKNYLNSPVIAGIIQVSGLFAVSFLYPFFQEKKRTQHELWKNSIKKKEESLASFSKALSETMLIQSAFKEYNYRAEFHFSTENTSISEACTLKAESLYMEFIKISTPFDAACKTAKLEFEEFEKRISKLENYVKSYIKSPSFIHNENNHLEKNPSLNILHRKIDSLYENITDAMASTIQSIRNSSS